jgi:hypothetical protein
MSMRTLVIGAAAVGAVLAIGFGVAIVQVWNEPTLPKVEQPGGRIFCHHDGTCGD